MRYTDENHEMTPQNGFAHKRGTGGFSLIELVITIAILGIIIGWAAASWTRYARYQNFRKEAIALHHEIMAMRANALSTGDSINIVLKNSTNSLYEIQVKKRDDDGTYSNNWSDVKTVNLTGKDIFSFNFSGNSGLPPIPAPNKWGTSAPFSIKIAPNNLSAFESGYVILNADNRAFCIIVGDQNVRPELYQRPGTSGAWRRI